jgi:transposase-like protein
MTPALPRPRGLSRRRWQTSFSWVGWRHDDLVRSPPIPAQHHPARSMVVPSLHPQLPRCRGFAGAMGVEVRAVVRQGTSHQTSRPTSRWHLDEMAVLIGGRRFWLWRAVDDEGEVLDLLVQRRRDARAAAKLMRKLLKSQGFAPETLITDKLRSYGAAKTQLGLSARHEQGVRKNNRAENSHLPVRRRERKMQRIQVARISATAPIRSRRGRQYVQRSAPSCFPQHPPRPQRRSVAELAGGDGGLSSAELSSLSFGQSLVLVTTPVERFLRVV